MCGAQEVLHGLQRTCLEEIALPFFPYTYEAFDHDFRGSVLTFLHKRLNLFQLLRLLSLELISIATKFTDHTIDGTLLQPQYLLALIRGLWLLLVSHPLFVSTVLTSMIIVKLIKNFSNIFQ